MSSNFWRRKRHPFLNSPQKSSFLNVLKIYNVPQNLVFLRPIRHFFLVFSWIWRVFSLLRRPVSITRLPPLSFKKEIKLQIFVRTNHCRVRPYYREYTWTRPISEVKPGQAQLVLRWATTWEHWVLYAFTIFFAFSIPPTPKNFAFNVPPMMGPEKKVKKRKYFGHPPTALDLTQVPFYSRP